MSLTRALATELGRHSMLVNSGAPGFTGSAFIAGQTLVVDGGAYSD
jgi:NAD(P)-dependent dehydrogenase (short-subunit alcohol dehydrogenase family)